MGRLNAGQLNQRVTLYTPGATTSDGQGGHIPGAETAETVSARVRPLQGGEKLALGAVLSADAVEVTVRKRAGVNASQGLSWKGQRYNVQAVTPDEYNEYLLLTCFNDGRS